MMNALDTYRKENKEKLANERRDMDREVLWQFVLDIDGVPSKRGSKRKRRTRTPK